ncbi:GrpE-domain-containing protein [Phlebopus sp. FC_14]|nr:GrpE-domain-containing protein [Phlebopus sp. FC_14]
MNAAYARHVLSSCTASLSSRALSRSSWDVLSHPARRLPLGTRWYSDDTSRSSPEGQSEPVSESVQEDTKTEEGEKIEITPAHELLEKLKAKEAETADLTSRLRYLQADFLNLQRNAAREKEQQRDFAITKFAGDLLETVDVLSLALKSVPQSALTPGPTAESSSSASSESSTSSSNCESSSPSSPETKSAQTYLTELHHGVEMTQRLLLSTLFKYHVKSFDPTGEKFDPNRHEALYQVPVPGKEPGTVLDCQKIGYTIKDRLLRAAQVGVVQEAS